MFLSLINYNFWISQSSCCHAYMVAVIITCVA
jgi:hypothetical protein